MNVRVEVSYRMSEVGVKGSEHVDKQIKDKIRNAGGTLYATGTDLETGIRELAFDMPVKTLGGD